MTFRDAVAQYFRQRPNTWIDGMEIAKIGGCYAWRTTLSRCHLQLGMDIENRIRKDGTRKISEYCYHPPQPVAQPSLFQEAVI